MIKQSGLYISVTGIVTFCIAVTIFSNGTVSAIAFKISNGKSNEVTERYFSRYRYFFQEMAEND